MSDRTIVVVVAVAIVALLFAIGFWPFYSQPWMGVVLNRIGEFVAVTVAIIALLVLQWGLWFGR